MDKEITVFIIVGDRLMHRQYGNTEGESLTLKESERLPGGGDP